MPPNFVNYGFVDSGGKYTTLNDPLAGTAPYQGTEAFVINDSGQIVGLYVGSNGISHGFFYSDYKGATYTTIDDPNAGTQPDQGTFVDGINDRGQIVGGYIYHGFLYSGGVYTDIDDPSAGTGAYQGTLGDGIKRLGPVPRRIH